MECSWNKFLANTLLCGCDSYKCTRFERYLIYYFQLVKFPIFQQQQPGTIRVKKIVSFSIRYLFLSNELQIVYIFNLLYEFYHRIKIATCILLYWMWWSKSATKSYYSQPNQSIHFVPSLNSVSFFSLL